MNRFNRRRVIKILVTRDFSIYIERENKSLLKGKTTNANSVHRNTGPILDRRLSTIPGSIDAIISKTIRNKSTSRSIMSRYVLTPQTVMRQIVTLFWQ
ncbi:uncharacterized protein LOC143147975 isoform X2 [Ptiloglossa arizonensis]|uniref:uncharacterized protein LOC143147975 isoform X2 n=1 Tax=Ptiloglossa arizonensis TaxID=3350558 RepID=UPI003F9F5CB2